ncbi:tripartite tricarboxylate transporter substrate binding protein [Ramlibacter sp. AW1]|uniref:Tripartite tricarboxylate transporter substrate binding protein n=1 Tax=Ramlibacter aurantiacus TaxID=2801330 RepID=A0A937D3V7_9BURK|nr:tripartite tricarboxylate transporter substrate binding protein [Ramlibacter aurantiacus]MBL0421100.1 tripartite tricarboxylate transporter substrate binding protein [Ramlibacter aurantiacus]
MNGDLLDAIARRELLRRAGLGALALAAGSSALAQAGDYPRRPIRVVVNNAAGGGVDVVARAITQPMSEAIGQPVVIDNRGGAGGLIGGEAVAKADADGYTLLATAGSMVVIAPHLYRKIAFDPMKDLVPVAPAGRATLFLVVRQGIPVQNVDQFIRHLKANAGKLSYGSAGNGSSLHLAGEMFKQQAGVDAVHVPYKGAAPAIQDLLGGQLDFMFDSGTALEHVRSGRLRLLAVANMARSSLFPDVPTLDQSGLKGFDAGSTYGFFAPANTPAEVVNRLNTEINRTMSLKPVRDRLMAIGAEPTQGTPQQFAAVLREDSRRFGEIVRERKITIE